MTDEKVILVGFVRESVILVSFLGENYRKPRRELSFSLLELSNSRLNIVICPLIRGEKRANSRNHNCIAMMALGAIGAIGAFGAMRTMGP